MNTATVIRGCAHECNHIILFHFISVCFSVLLFRFLVTLKVGNVLKWFILVIILVWSHFYASQKPDILTGVCRVFISIEGWNTLVLHHKYPVVSHDQPWNPVYSCDLWLAAFSSVTPPPARLKTPGLYNDCLFRRLGEIVMVPKRSLK